MLEGVVSSPDATPVHRWKISMLVIENGHGNIISLHVSAKFKRSDKYLAKPPVRLLSSSHCRTVSCHHGVRTLSPMEPRIPNEIPDPALDSTLDRRTPLPQGILASPVRSRTPLRVCTVSAASTVTTPCRDPAWYSGPLTTSRSRM